MRGRRWEDDSGIDRSWHGLIHESPLESPPVDRRSGAPERYAGTLPSREQPRSRNEERRDLEDRGVNLAHKGENSRGLPHTPSLELSVLPNGGGQSIELWRLKTQSTRQRILETKWS